MVLVLKNGDVIMFEGDIKSLPQDVAGCPAIECEFAGGGKYYFYDYLNFGNWNIDRYGNMTDCRQEVRIISYPEKVLRIVRDFGSWLEYDANQEAEELQRVLSEKEFLKKECSSLEEELNKAKIELDDLYNAIKIVYDLNENGGAGSRRKVRDLLAKHITVCEYCGFANCVCEK